jgi:type II secretory pathway component PulK
MRPRSLRATGRRSEPGFALLIVLWFLVLLSAVAIHLTASGRVEVALARNTIATAKAESLADAALVRAAFSLGDPRPQIGWAADGAAHVVALPDGEAEVVAEDENGRVNLNLASHDLLLQLFLALDAGRDTADAVSTAIIRHRDGPGAVPGSAAATASSPAGSPAPPSQPAGEPGQMSQPLPAAQPGQPPTGGGSPFETVDDAGLLPEMSPELLATARPYLTVYTTAPMPDPTHASDIVRRVLASIPQTPGGGQAQPPAAGAPVAAAPQIFHLTIRARTKTGARFGREAVIRIDPGLPKGYGVLWWRRFDSAPLDK